MESTLAPLGIFGLGTQELVIILIIALLLFGGSRLAGIGKSSGRAIREFKEETRGLKEDERKAREEKVTRELEPKPELDEARDPATEKHTDI